MDRVVADPDSAPISRKLRALLRIAERVQAGCRSVDVAHPMPISAFGAPRSLSKRIR